MPIRKINITIDTIPVYGDPEGKYEEDFMAVINAVADISPKIDEVTDDIDATVDNITQLKEAVILMHDDFKNQAPLNGGYDQATIDQMISDLNQAIVDLGGGAPEALNTIVELAAALNDDENFATAVLSQLSQKANTSDMTIALEGKSDTGHNHVEDETVSASTIVKRTADEDIAARLFKSTYQVQTATPATTAEILFRNSVVDNFHRTMSSTAFKNWLTAIGVAISDTNTWRGISDSVTTIDSTTSASLTGVKTAYDKGVDALNVANSKLSQVPLTSGAIGTDRLCKANGTTVGDGVAINGGYLYTGYFTAGGSWTDVVLNSGIQTWRNMSGGTVANGGIAVFRRIS
ncbi:MAG: hypothetical protein C0625_01645 [Arcobacter sp.]|nr:MAG: hypothetical protein C0625_01645 [Arcobacter sp.]